MFLLRPLPTRASPFQPSLPTKIVFVGFGHTYTVEEAKEEMYSEEYGDMPHHGWLHKELSLMTSALIYSLGHERIVEWRKMERERKLMVEYFYFL